jgi:endonuclease YncB( thermonuclease family)
VVSCELSGTDRYGRALAICTEGGEDLNAMMVQDGMAVAYRAFSRRYVGEEDEAKQVRRGIWSTEFEVPAKLTNQVRHRLCPGSPWDRRTATSRLKSGAAIAA